MSGALSVGVNLPTDNLSSGLEDSTLGTGGYVGEGYQTTDLVNDAIDAANAYGVPANLFVQQIGVESGFDPSATSPTGVQGIAQLTQSTWNEITGGQPYSTDPQAQLNAAAAYDAAEYQQTGSWAGALSAYAIGANGNPSTLTPAYQNLVNEAAGVGTPFNGSGVSTVQPSGSVASSSGGGFWDMVYNALTGDAQAEGEVSGAGTPGVNQQAPSLPSMSFLSGVTSWIGNSAITVAVVVIGIVLLAAALFMLGGGKPRDVIALAGE
jgi:hypothetical protein